MSDVAPRTPCPDAESLAAYVDGRTGAADRAEVERHLAECADCRELIGAAVELTGESEGLSSAPPRRRTLRWYVAGAGLVAAAAAVIIAVRLQQSSRELYVPEMAELVAAVGASRPIEPRLTGGFAYGPPPPVMRSGSGSSEGLWAAGGAAAKLRERIGDADSAREHAALGVAYLVMREPARAVRSLQEASAQQPDDPRILSDLAAAYLVRGRATGEAQDFVLALNAAGDAIRRPNAPLEAWFNRALAAEAIGPASAAIAAWREYLQRDSASPWAEEARRHLAALETPRESRENSNGR